MKKYLRAEVYLAILLYRKDLIFSPHKQLFFTILSQPYKMVKHKQFVGNF